MYIVQTLRATDILIWEEAVLVILTPSPSLKKKTK